MDQSLPLALRVAIIAGTALDKPADGIASYLRALVLNSGEMHFTFWGTGEDATITIGNQGIECRALGKPVGVLSILPRRVQFMLAIWRNRSEICANVDVVFAHDSDCVVPFGLPRRLVPIVLVRHGWNPPSIAASRGKLVYWWLRLSDRLALGIAEKVIVVSEEGFMAFWNRYSFARRKLVHIPTFVNDDVRVATRDFPGVERWIGLRPRFLCASRLVVEKQVDKSIEFLALIRRTQQDAILLVAGSGPEEQKLRSLARALSVEDAVIFLGMVPHQEMPMYYSVADCFLLFSVWEGTSIALLEALAHGVPAIVTDIADHRSIVTDGRNGFVVSRRRPAEEATECLNERARLDSFSRERVRRTVKRFLASAVVPRIESELRQTAASSSVRLRDQGRMRASLKRNHEASAEETR